MSPSWRDETGPYAHEPVRRGVINETPAPESNTAPNVHMEAGMRLLRGPSNPRDRALTDLAQTWLEQLPENLVPRTLAQAYPRIANRLALCWADRTLRHLLFTDLLGSRRQGRRGFPPVVHAELMALRAYASTGAPGASKRQSTLALG